MSGLSLIIIKIDRENVQGFIKEGLRGATSIT